MLFKDQLNVNTITTTKKRQSQIIIIIVSPRAQMIMSLKCEERAAHTFRKKSLFSFSLVWFIF